MFLKKFLLLILIFNNILFSIIFAPIVRNADVVNIIKLDSNYLSSNPIFSLATHPKIPYVKSFYVHVEIYKTTNTGNLIKVPLSIVKIETFINSNGIFMDNDDKIFLDFETYTGTYKIREENFRSKMQQFLDEINKRDDCGCVIS